jgi:hypothetical protein
VAGGLPRTLIEMPTDPERGPESETASTPARSRGGVPGRRAGGRRVSGSGSPAPRARRASTAGPTRSNRSTAGGVKTVTKPPRASETGGDRTTRGTARSRRGSFTSSGERQTRPARPAGAAGARGSSQDRRAPKAGRRETFSRTATTDRRRGGFRREPEVVGPERGWGGVARRGAAQLRRPAGGAERAFPQRSTSPPPEPDQWVRVEASRGSTRRSAPSPQVYASQRARSLSPEVAAEIREAAGLTPRATQELVSSAERAVGALDADRFGDALRLARSVLRAVPNVPEMHAVAGLAAYRLGRWQQGARELEGYRVRTGASDLVPPLMDCYRALGRTQKVAQLWTELRRTPVDADLLTEARMVGAGALADRGDLAGAISLLAAGSPPKSLRNPAARHLRRWYALGDLYEQAGDVPRARELFGRVAKSDPDAYDVRARLDGLGRSRKASRTKRVKGATSTHPVRGTPRAAP